MAAVVLLSFGAAPLDRALHGPWWLKILGLADRLMTLEAGPCAVPN